MIRWYKKGIKIQEIFAERSVIVFVRNVLGYTVMARFADCYESDAQIIDLRGESVVFVIV